MKTVEVTNFAYKFAKSLESWTQETLFSNFSLTTKFDWSASRLSSRGGLYKTGPGINIAMMSAFPKVGGNTPYRFKEYPSYDQDKVIGGFYALDPYLKLKAIVAHEVAHAIQFYSYTVLGTRCKPHGPVFKSYYKMLRVRFVNNDVPLTQNQLKKDYDDYIAQLVKTTNAASRSDNFLVAYTYNS